MARKGKVILRLGTPLDGEFESADEVAAEIDRQILSNLQLFPVNYWAMSRLEDPAYQSLSHRVPTIEKKELLDTYAAAEKLSRRSTGPTG